MAHMYPVILTMDVQRGSVAEAALNAEFSSFFIQTPCIAVYAVRYTYYADGNAIYFVIYFVSYPRPRTILSMVLSNIISMVLL